MRLVQLEEVVQGNLVPTASAESLWPLGSVGIGDHAQIVVDPVNLLLAVGE
ncbi:hypothetical protein ABS772_03755 [Methylorubrum podarium]|uniref:CheW-like domain-containing protein n=1 Tax=Methylorubrum podarium TaxID=200476 RepID=A0ABV1QI57_9HYPH